MHTTRLLKMLSQIPPKAFRRFCRFVHSPYYNRNPLLNQLADILAASFPQFDSPSLNRHQLFTRFFPDRPFEIQKLHDLFSYMVTLLEEFIAVEEWQKSPFDKSIYLLKGLRETGFHQAYQRKYKGTLRKLNAWPLRNKQYYLDEYKLMDEYQQFHDSAVKKYSRVKETTIGDQMASLEKFYLAVAFHTGCEMINRQNILAVEFDRSILAATMQHYESQQDRLADTPIIRIYYTLLKTLLESENETHFLQIEELLDEFADQFGREEAQEMYIYAQNYCIKQIKVGNAKYQRVIFNLFKQLLSKELLLDNGQLSQWDYKNIVTIALRINEIEWAEKFIFEYLPKLPPDVRDNAFAYNYGFWLYTAGQNSQALKKFQEVTFSDIFYELGTKSLILRIYYEQDEMDALFNFIHSFQTFLRRNSLISPFQYETYSNLLALTGQLYRLKLNCMTSGSNAHAESMAQLKSKIETMQPLAGREWLLERLEQISGGT